MSDITIPQVDPNAPPVETPEVPAQHSEETLRLAALGRGEEPSAPVTPEPKVRPDHIPEKFWDVDKGEVRIDELAKSYVELEKFKGTAPKDPPPVSPEEAAKATEEEAVKAAEEAAAVGVPAELFTSARDEYAQSGELGQETREKIIAAGIDQDTLDTYLAGVKALEAQLEAQVYATAGGEEAYRNATAWAQQNWDQKKIDGFNAAINNPAVRDIAIKGLIAEAGSAPSEGRLTLPGGAVDAGGDFYTDKDEFLQDLAKAEETNDLVARKKAVAKLERSKKAGRLAGITPRSGLSRFG